MPRPNDNLPRPLPLVGRRVTLMGLGRHGGGVAAARLLARQGAIVTVTDTADEQDLADSRSQLADLPIDRYILGHHREADFASADLIVVNPAVRPENRYIELARQNGVTITSEIELFLEHCPGHIIGVTGTNGKSTTAAMLANVLKADGREALLGGNIERSLLSQLDAMSPETWCILELSSFQLDWLRDGTRRPDIAVITNLEPNHLDWHAQLDAYRDAKRRIVGPETILFDPTGALGSPTHDLTPAAQSLPPLPLPGEHNRQNAALAATVAKHLGCSAKVIERGLSTFEPLPHRLEVVTRVEGRTFVNDSQATTPGSTFAALETLGPNCWLLAGGADKGADLSDMAAAIVGHASGAAFFGQLGPELRRLVQARSHPFRSRCFANLEEAFTWSVAASSTSDTLLLSPGCSSLDQYRDYAARADDFRRLVASLTSTAQSNANASNATDVGAI